MEGRRARKSSTRWAGAKYPPPPREKAARYKLNADLAVAALDGDEPESAATGSFAGSGTFGELEAASPLTEGEG